MSRMMRAREASTRAFWLFVVLWVGVALVMYVVSEATS